MLEAAARLAVEARREQAADHDLGLVGVGVGQDEGELVAADPEGPVRAAHVRRDRRGGLAQDLVARRMAARVVDPLEVVEVDDRERHRPAGPGRDRPLPLDLLLERAVVAEPGQRVAQGLGASPVVGVLEDPAGLLQPLGGLEDAAGQPDGEDAEDERESEDGQGRDDERVPCPAPARR